jgi:lipase chaperone LimK
VLGQKQLQKERLALAAGEFSDEIQRHFGDETERQSAVVNLEEGE